MKYKIANARGYLTTYLTTGAITIFFLLIFTFVVWWEITLAESKGSYLIYWLFAALAIFVVGIIVIILMMVFHIKKGDYGVLWIEILDDGIAYGTPKHIYKISYSYFVEKNIEIHMGIFSKGYRWHTFSVLEFLQNAMKYINDALSKMSSKEKDNLEIDINVTNPNEKALKQVMFKFQVFPFGKGANMSLETFENMLNEWREKYERYLKKTGKYQEAIEKSKMEKTKLKKKKSTPAMARIHFYTLTAIIIFAVITFVYFSIIPYLGTSPSSPDFAYRITYLVSDGFLTIALIVIGIIKLPKLWKRMHQKGGD